MERQQICWTGDIKSRKMSANTIGKIENNLKNELVSDTIYKSIISFIDNSKIKILKANNNIWVELDFLRLAEEDPHLEIGRAHV